VHLLLILLLSTLSHLYITPHTLPGGNKGIGKEIARRIGREPNFTVLIACRNLELGQEAIQDLKSCNNNDDDDKECNVILLPMPLDLTNPTSIKAAAKWVENEYNGVLDVLINNAAICFNSPTLYDKVDYTTFEDQADITIDTNYFGTLHVIQSFLQLLQKSDSPRIINIASSAGRLSILKSQQRVDTFTPDTLTIPQLTQLMQDFVKNVKDGTHSSNGWPNTCYGVSKVGIIALTKILARQYYPQMKINSVDPGYCKTDQNDNMGTVDPYRGAYTPYLLATASSLDNSEDEEEGGTGLHFYEERSILVISKLKIR